MYSRILVTLDHSRSDAAILTHVRGLAKVASEVRRRTFVPVLLVRTPPHPAS